MIVVAMVPASHFFSAGHSMRDGSQRRAEQLLLPRSKTECILLQEALSVLGKWKERVCLETIFPLPLVP